LQHNQLLFEGVFLVDVEPYELALGCLAQNVALVFQVAAGYQVRPYIEPREAFDALMAALRTGANSGQPFNASTFLREIDAALPQRANTHDVPTPADVVRVYRHVEEADKVHFCGWLPHPLGGERGVTPKNLAKTRLCLGEHSYAFCQRNNVSSRWTDKPDLAQAITPPPTPKQARR